MRSKPVNVAQMVVTRFFRTCGFWLLIGFFWSGCSHSQPGLPFDIHVEGLEQTRLITGDEAIHAINKLHGMPIDVVRGFIVYYEGVHEKATVWVSEASSEDLARKQIETMVSKMKVSKRSPFRDFRVLDIEDLSVKVFDGMGQVHYIFSDNVWVYWISAKAHRINKMLEHICKSG